MTENKAPLSDPAPSEEPKANKELENIEVPTIENEIETTSQGKVDEAVKETRVKKTASKRKTKSTRQRKKKTAEPAASPTSAEPEKRAVKKKAPAAEATASTEGEKSKTAGVRSDGRQDLLQVNSYEEAVALLTKKPELIEQARLIFGRIVPTTGQTDLVDLAIKAAAADDDLTLRGALATKREGHLALTHPEVTQLLEFAHTALEKAPILSLSVALLLTDDLTRLENGELWQQQKQVILAAEQALKLDATDLWEQINEPGPGPKPAPETGPPPALETEKPEVTRSKPQKSKRKAGAGPVPVTSLRREKLAKRSGHELPRWAMFTIFFTLLTVMSCCLCALGAFAGY